MKQIAQLDFGPLKGLGTSPLGNPTGNGIGDFANFISSTIGVMTIVAFIWFTFTLITGAIGIMNAGGDKAALEGARKKITNGIIGVVLVISATFIISLIGTIFGIDFLKINILFGFITGSYGGPSNGPPLLIGQPR